MLQCHEPIEHAQNISVLAPTFETPVRGFSHVRRKTEAQQVDEVKFAVCVAQPDHIARSASVFLQRLQRVFDAAIRKISKERIARAEREKPKRWTIVPSNRRKRFRKKAVHDFKG